MDKGKLKQAVHFICSTATGLPLGATRLNKILWFVEKEHFLSTLSPIIGIEFVKGPFGPMPSTEQMQDAYRELENEGKIRRTNLTMGRYSYVELQSLVEPDTSLFSDEQIYSIKDMTLEICTEHTARSISDLTHNDIYTMLSMGERYPLEMALVEKTRSLSSDEIASVISDAERHAI